MGSDDSKKTVNMVYFISAPKSFTRIKENMENFNDYVFF
jgi:hypothetical protein